jgi:hypothetical protein
MSRADQNLTASTRVLPHDPPPTTEEVPRAGYRDRGMRSTVTGVCVEYRH